MSCLQLCKWSVPISIIRNQRRTHRQCTVNMHTVSGKLLLCDPDERESTERLHWHAHPFSVLSQSTVWNRKMLSHLNMNGLIKGIWYCCQVNKCRSVKQRQLHLPQIHYIYLLNKHMHALGMYWLKDVMIHFVTVLDTLTHPYSMLDLTLAPSLW